MFPYTLDQLKALRKAALEELIEFAGGRSHLAKMLDRPLPTINSWVDRGMISKGGAEDVGKHPALAKDFPMSRLRPDL